MSIGPVREPTFAGPPSAGAVSPGSPVVATPQASEAPSPFARMLEGFGREVRHGESLMHRAIDATHAGSSIDPADLIALQVGVYRYSETVDLASRLIDRATSAVKTVLQGQ